MSLTIELPHEAILALESKARLSGLSPEDYARLLLERELGVLRSGSWAHLQRTDPKEWSRLLDDWLDNQDPSRPTLSDEAVSRESTYPDRF